MQVVLFALVKEDGELFLSDQLRQAAGRGDVAGRQRGERSGVEVLGGSDGGDELAVLVDEKDDLGVGLASQPLADRADLLELLVVHHHLRLHSRDLFLSWESLARTLTEPRGSVQEVAPRGSAYISRCCRVGPIPLTLKFHASPAGRGRG